MRNCGALQLLYISGNMLTGVLPDWMGSLCQLTELGVGDNMFEQLPRTLAKLTRLTWLSAYNNRLSVCVVHGCIVVLQPIGVCGCWCIYVVLCLPCTNMCLIARSCVPPSSSHSLISHRLCVLSDFKQGKLPAGLANLAQLTLLDLSLNRFSSSAVPDLPIWTNLTTCALELNPFACPLPTWMQTFDCQATCN